MIGYSSMCMHIRQSPFSRYTNHLQLTAAGVAGVSGAVVLYHVVPRVAPQKGQGLVTVLLWPMVEPTVVAIAAKQPPVTPFVVQVSLL